MFKRIFFNRLKILLRNKTMLFWTLIFPFILGTFFQLALSNVDEAYKHVVFQIAIVNNENFKQDKSLQNIITELSKEGENQLFTAIYVDEEKAQKLLSNNEIEGYILLKEKNKPTIIVNKNGINQTIMKSTLDEYYQMTNVANQAISYNSSVLYNGIINSLYETADYVENKSNENIDFSINYFFTLIAMACLYGALIGLEVIKDSEANLSIRGARVCIAPVSKTKIMLASILAGYVIQVVAIGLLFLYLIGLFKVNFGNQVLATIILAMSGCLMGTTLGVFIGVCNKKSENFKVGLVIAVTMLCCFFSGMMGTLQLRTFFDEKLPILSKLNPINMITDGLYSLFAYSTLDVYYMCLARTLAFSFVLIILVFLFVRRKRYDSI